MSLANLSHTVSALPTYKAQLQALADTVQATFLVINEVESDDNLKEKFKTDLIMYANVSRYSVTNFIVLY